MKINLLIAAVLLSTLNATVSMAAEPNLYHLVYRARASGLSATAERELQAVETGNLLLRNYTQVKVAGVSLGTVDERSEVRWTDGGLVPLSYNYRQTGIGGTEESVSFDWDAGSALSSEEDESWQLALRPGTWDKLSMQLQLSLDLASGARGDLEYLVVDGDEIESQLYRVIGEEIVATAAGDFNTLKVERIRGAQSRRQTTFWLALDWDLMLVKFLQVSGSGNESTLLLEHGTLGDRTITGLP